jgi:hypothetical protein
VLLASKWRLLIPVRTVKSAAWEDRLFLADPDELFEVLNVVRYLLKTASRTGRWNPRDAIAAVSRKMGDPEWHRVPEVVRGMERQARDHIVSAVQIREICAGLELEERTDVLIAEMKGMGVMSPKLSSLALVSQAGAPVYELNPSLRMGGISRDARLPPITGGRVRAEVAERESRERLAGALAKRFPASECSALAGLLSLAWSRPMLSYDEIEVETKCKEELLMVAHRERLLVSTSRSSMGGASWQEKVLTFSESERYQMPRIVRHLIEVARENGKWEPRHAIVECLKEVGEGRAEDLVRFLEGLLETCPEHRVDPEMMGALGLELGMELDLHRVIDEFVRCGIISSPIQASIYRGSAVYEINPCLSWGSSGEQ